MSDEEKALCKECGWNGISSQVMLAANPFKGTETVSVPCKAL